MKHTSLMKRHKLKHVSYLSEITITLDTVIVCLVYLDLLSMEGVSIFCPVSSCQIPPL